MKQEKVELVIECVSCKKISMFTITKEHLAEIDKCMPFSSISPFSTEDRETIRNRTHLFPLCAKCDAKEGEQILL